MADINCKKYTSWILSYMLFPSELYCCCKIFLPRSRKHWKLCYASDVFHSWDKNDWWELSNFVNNSKVGTFAILSMKITNNSIPELNALYSIPMYVYITCAVQAGSFFWTRKQSKLPKIKIMTNVTKSWFTRWKSNKQIVVFWYIMSLPMYCS